MQDVTLSGPTKAPPVARRLAWQETTGLVLHTNKRCRTSSSVSPETSRSLGKERSIAAARAAPSTARARARTA
jgi:hypothetical protein